MCAFVKDRIVRPEGRIYESVRRIYDIRSSSEDSLNNKNKHSNESSMTNSQRVARKVASLFIDRIKNDFQREDEFVPRFRTRKNWFPKFITTNYFSKFKRKEKEIEKKEDEDDEQSKSLGKSVTKSLVSVAPKIYSIGLCESMKITKPKIDSENVINQERVVDDLKQSSFLIPRNLSVNKMETKKWMPKLFSSSVTSIPPVINIPIEFHLSLVKENNQFVRSDVTIHDSIYYSLSQQSLLFEEDDKFDENECTTSSKNKLSNSTEHFISEQFIPNIETLRNENHCHNNHHHHYHPKEKQLEKDYFLEDVSSIDSCTSKCGEFFTPLETTRKIVSLSDDDCSDNGILEDIRKRIDQDFEITSSSNKIIDEHSNDYFGYTENCHFFDKKNDYYSNRYERYSNSNDDLITSIEQSKSMPIISTTNTHYHSSKSLTLISSTLIDDDYYDKSSSKNNVERLNDFKDHSLTDRSSMNSTIYYDYNYDLPLNREESIKFHCENDKTHFNKSLLNYSKMTDVFSIPNVTRDDKIDLSLKLNAFNPTKSKKMKLHKESLTKSKLSEHLLVESIDSGVITDYSRNDFHVCECLYVENDAKIVPVKQQQQFYKNTSYNVTTDSVCSDDSLDRRVDLAVQKCTEDLIILERKIQFKLKTIETSPETSRNNLFHFFDCIDSISTPSLISLTDSETS
ncbi:hypothetical protein M0804_004118 [Polistes exclamans]|nr:hypothetical protein M0804_004118 [Polistes exclamans]